MIIRPLQPDDHDQIAGIARSVDAFTVPSAYMIWMLCESQAGLCQVAIDDKSGAVAGYALAMHTANPSEMFLWQLACASEQLYQASDIMNRVVSAVIDEAVRRGISACYFTCLDARVDRLKNLVTRVCQAEGKQIGRSAPTNGVDEAFFRFEIKPHDRRHTEH